MTKRPGRSGRPKVPGYVGEIADLLARWELGSAYRLRAAAGRARLSEPEFLVLSELAVRPDGLCGVQLTWVVGIGSGGISGILTRLEAQGLIERGPDREDRRTTTSFATAAGRKLLRDKTGDVAERRDLAELLDGLGPARAAVVVEFLGIVTDRAYRQSKQIRELRPKR